MTRRVGVDIDGVIGNFELQARTMLKRQFGVDITPSETWNWIPDHCTKEQWDWLWRGEPAAECFGQMPVFPGARTALGRLKKAGLKVSLITSCPPQARAARIQWLATKNVPHDDLHFVHASEKYIVDCDVYVEDNIDNAQAILDNAVPLMVPVYLVDRLYNREEAARELRRVTGLEGAVEDILKG